MSVAPEEVEKLARLARLRLDESQRDRITQDLNKILAYVDVLLSVRTETEPEEQREADALSGAGVSADRYPDPLHRNLADAAPDWREGFFIVPPPPGVQASDEDPS